MESINKYFCNVDKYCEKQNNCIDKRETERSGGGKDIIHEPLEVMGRFWQTGTGAGSKQQKWGFWGNFRRDRIHNHRHRNKLQYRIQTVNLRWFEYKMRMAQRKGFHKERWLETLKQEQFSLGRGWGTTVGFGLLEVGTHEEEVWFT